MPRPLDVLEGDARSIAVILRFPCRANAMAFWNSQTYQNQIKALRSNPPAADLSIAIFPEAALRPDMVGKVGENGYNASFDASAVPQVSGQR